ncbi:cupin domain-containing protein [Polaromonas sp.]|jgi:mannose-6-phosphate isomerase-like protein (cupin superfamily)|uniref:cupin domain-containing protein n=1 Tax=Polaromonas sp. TaxID=1869339 RepID=UPI002B700CB9|nr:cupin domain-containing protein [Polaromonas sp.]HQS31613.1 cupin domain-containing protein [Polaromonas sp.]
MDLSMKTSIDQALMLLPAAPTDTWPEGAPFLAMMAGGTMTVEVFAPGISSADEDLQTMHTQDELYFVQSGRGELVIKEQRFRAAQGDAFFVPAGIKHRFENFSKDFVTWVVLYGPQGGERYAVDTGATRPKNESISDSRDFEGH